MSASGPVSRRCCWAALAKRCRCALEEVRPTCREEGIFNSLNYAGYHGKMGGLQRGGERVSLSQA